MTFQLFPSKKILPELDAINTQEQTTFLYVTNRAAFCYELFSAILIFLQGKDSLKCLRISTNYSILLLRESQCDMLQFANQGRMLFVLWWQLSDNLLMLPIVNKTNKKLLGLLIYYSNRGLKHPLGILPLLE